MRNQNEYGARQHHIDTQQRDIAPTVLIPGDPRRVHMFASLMDKTEIEPGLN